MVTEKDFRFLDIVNQIVASESVDELSAISFEMCEAYGLANIVYRAVHLPQSDSFNPILIPTYDPEWIERYIGNDYFRIDPVVNSGMKGFLPLDWSNVDRESGAAREFFIEADRYGVGRQGVTLPIRGPHGERALFTITSNLSWAEWDKNRLVYMKEFQVIAHYFHDRVVQVSGYRTSIDGPLLSPREMECLELTAAGLVPKRVAAQLNISGSAVRLYLRSACRKLGCASVHQAIAKMITLELLHPRL
jgi:DNA-binding CsgD family transcriptional regulator